MKNLMLILTACFIFGCNSYKYTECLTDKKEEIQTFYHNCLAQENHEGRCAECAKRVAQAFPSECMTIKTNKPMPNLIFINTNLW